MSASVFPAPAGMSRFRAAAYSFGEGFPRTCGDEPFPVLALEAAAWFSPHLRG